jgi:hypothetical protein
MWTRSAKSKETGLFTVVCYDWSGAEFFRGEFADHIEADVAGHDAERRATLAAQQAKDPISLDDIEAILGLSDDGLLPALRA